VTDRSGHDVAEDMLDAGLAQVTMIQRSPTCRFTIQELELIQRMLNLHRRTPSRIPRGSPWLYVHRHSFPLLTLTHVVTYNATFPTDLADELTNSLPMAAVSLLQNGFLHHKATLEPERFDALSRAGFKVERYGSLAHHLYERSGGHYVDVGASGKISKGLVSYATQLCISR